MGEQNWYSARVYMTQYALRNTYYGMFVNGKRQGQGTFLYANGAKYEGSWVKDLKDGWVSSLSVSKRAKAIVGSRSLRVKIIEGQGH